MWLFSCGLLLVVSVTGNLYTMFISGLRGMSENRDWVDLCSCCVAVDPFLASCLKQDCPTCPTRIGVYGEMLVSPLACPLLHSGQPALFPCTFYRYLGVTLGHWVPGAEMSLSILLLYNVQH